MTYQRVEGQFPLVGAGGIQDAASAIAKMEAGASLLQFYSAMVYRGPGMVRDILAGLRAHLDKAQVAQVSALTGRNASDWASRAIAQG